MLNESALFIQPLSVTDAPQLTDLARRAYCDHYLHLWYDGGEWYLQRCFTVPQLEAELGDSNSRFFLIHQEGQPVGFLKLNLDQPEPDRAGESASDALELERIYFVGEATGRGIGSAALRFVDDYARSLGKKTVWLKAMDSSAEAISFYQKNGYQPVGTYRLPFSQMKEELRGMVILSKPLR